jgi:hypothetical protein
VKRCDHDSEKIQILPKLDEGSEHLVYLREEDAEIFKVTRPGIYGELYYLVNNVVNQRNCSPLEYLVRLRLWKKIFGSAPEALGVTDQGSIVALQKYIQGTVPSQEDVDAFLELAGLEGVKRERWLWRKTYPEFEIWVGDTREDNFVDTKEEIVPIDVRLWFTDPPEADVEWFL